MEIRLLGPLQVSSNGRVLELGGGRQRAVLAIMALHANEVVSTDRLIDHVWADRAPATAPKALQNLVSRLRKVLDPEEPGVLRTQPPGYVLTVADDAIDIRRFERLAAEGRHALESDPKQAAATLRESLDLWRGEALAEFAYEPFAQSEIERLQELRLAATEDRIEADLALGRHVDVTPELRTLAAANPTRDRLVGQLMLALYRTGRQAEALDVYQERRRRLNDELGLEPSAELRRLERAILTQDESLGPAPRPPRVPPARRRRIGSGAAIVAALAVATAVAAALLLARGDGVVPAVQPNSLLKIDSRTNEIVGAVPVGRDPGQVAIVGHYVFVTSRRDQTLHRIDTRSGRVTVSGAFAAAGPLVGAGRLLWVVSEKRSEVVQTDVESLRPGQTIPLRRGLSHVFVALGGGSLWTSEYAPGSISRYRLRTLAPEERLALGAPDFAEPFEIIYADSAAWVALEPLNELLRIDDFTGLTTRSPVGSGPSGLAFGFGSIWIGSAGDRALWRVDPLSERTIAIIPLDQSVFSLAVGAGSVWVTSRCENVVSRIDPRTSSVVATIETKHVPRWLAVGSGFAWVGVGGSDEGGSCT